MIRIALATPKWINFNELEQFYSNCPEGYSVDHIIPIQNDKVCGLNIISNLQYLPINLNKLKCNTFDGTYNNDSWKVTKKRK